MGARALTPLCPQVVNSRRRNPGRVRPVIHPGQTAGDETRAAQFSRWGLGRRSIPAERVAARRSSLRFGRNTPGIPPSRALSAGCLPGLGAHPGSTTGCSPRRCAPLIVAFRSQYTGYSSLTRLVSRAPRPHRENWPASALTRVPPPAVRLSDHFAHLSASVRQPVSGTNSCRALRITCETPS